MSTVGRLYEVFAKYPTPRIQDADPTDCTAGDGTAERIELALRAKPLAELSDGDLLDFYYLAITHCGTIDAFKHYLPRILELMATIRRPLISVRLLESRLRDARFNTWPQDERNIVLTFCREAAPDSRLHKVAQELSA